jgi:hypothetical protein
MTDMNAVNISYPQCTQAGVNPANVFVAVHAAKGNRLTSSSAVRVTFGMALWVSIIIHIIGVEIYVRTTVRLLCATALDLITEHLDPIDRVFEPTQARVRAGTKR